MTGERADGPVVAGAAPVPVMRPSPIVWVALSAIPAGMALIAWLSPAWRRGTITTDHPVIALVAILLATSLIWLFLVRTLAKPSVSKAGRGLLALLFLSGLLSRAVFFGSTPVYEDDWERYLWDGAVTANGQNPYLYSPEEIAIASQPGEASEPDLARLAILSRTSGGTIARINNPDLTTIYPPAAQAAFAVAYRIDPFGTTGLRVVFLLSDLAALALLIVALSQWKRPLIWSFIYWLNPILIFTVYSGLHMDILLLAPLLAALILSRRRPVLGGLSLAIAAAIKIWPLLLAPLLFRHLRERPIRLAGLALIVTGLTLALLAPMLLNSGQGSGLAAYSGSWTNSSFFFPGLRDALGLASEDPDRLARLCVATVVVSASLALGLLSREDPKTLPLQSLLLVALLIWLSPTGYPWYLIWLLPFLALAPRLWIGTVFLGAAAYYARFWLGEHGHYAVYTRLLVPLWFGVPLFLLALQWRQSHVRTA